MKFLSILIWLGLIIIVSGGVDSASNDGVSEDPVVEVDEEAEKVEGDKVEGDVAELGPDSAPEGDESVAAGVEAGVNGEEAETAEGASAEHEDVEEAVEEEEAARNDSSTEIDSVEKANGKQTTDTESVDYADDEAVSPTVEMGTEADATATATEDSDENVSVTPASNNALVGKEPLAVVKCFACTSLNDANCTTKAEVQVNCKPLQGTTENGCYTLVKVDLNTTTRGCISELAEVGMKYCQDNGRFCMLCYADGCNNRQATAASHANPLSQHVALAVFLLAVTGAYYF